jgi:cytidylate kinase
MRITISGLPGSGTTTVARMLASQLDYRLISAGEIFRELARKKNYSLEQFSKIAEKDSEIDTYIDRMQKEMAEKEENVVVEGRLSGWMIEDAFKVFIFADHNARFSRIARRESKDINQARDETLRREEYERRRYRKFYGINIDDWSIYHLILNSGYFEAGRIVDIILNAISSGNLE